MCGIAGLFAGEDSARAGDRLRAIRDHMRSRGPDDSGEARLAGGRLHFGHRRLSIIDLSPAGHQPMQDSTGALTIVYNGEIYNHPELRAGLVRDGYAFRSDSDTETILNLFLRDGRAALTKLRGMFAIALWDERSQELLLARDTHGIKPLYYRTAPTFAFASQVRALLADSETPRTLNHAAAMGYAIWGSVPEPQTIVEGTLALPAGHTLVVGADGVPKGEPRPFLTLAEVLREGRDQAPGDGRAALLDSVSHHLLADVEVGCFLSAGVDSSAILGMMRDAGASRVKAITLRFAEYVGTSRDEAPLAAMIAERYGAHHIIETIEASDFTLSLPAIGEAMDQPSIDGVNSWFVSRAAARAGLKVALSGLGGDELLAGYSTFASVPRTYQVARRIGGVPVVGALARKLSARLLGGKRGEVLDFARTLSGAYLARRAMHLPKGASSLLPEGISADALSRQSLLGPVDDVSRSLGGESCALTVSALESSFYMRNQLLRDSDWAGMAHSLEVRLPLVDVELSRAMAAHLPRLANGGGKRLLGSAPSLPLPDSIVSRRKTGFGIPVDQWISGKPQARLADDWAGQVLTNYIAAERLTV